MSRHIFSTSVNVDVDVDISTDDLEDEDLLELCQARGIGGFNKETIDELFVLFKMGKHDAVLERVRQVVQDAKGVVL